VIATRAFYAPEVQIDLPLTAADDYSAVERALGQPQAQRWRSGPNEQYELLAYPQRRLYVILMGRDRAGASARYMRYIGAMDWNWRPAHAVDLAGYGSSYGLLRRLPKF
jgi:hypothetical protein